MSRLAFEQALALADALGSRAEVAEGQVARLLDHVTRIERVAAGLPEKVRERKTIALSSEILAEIGKWGEQSREHLQATALRALARGQTEDEILAKLRAKTGEE